MFSSPAASMRLNGSHTSVLAAGPSAPMIDLDVALEQV